MVEFLLVFYFPIFLRARSAFLKLCGKGSNIFVKSSSDLSLLLFAQCPEATVSITYLKVVEGQNV